MDLLIAYRAPLRTHLVDQPVGVDFLPTSSQAISLPVAGIPLVLLRTAVSTLVLVNPNKPEQRNQELH